jgi:chemotaxis signal transduction protein
VYGFRRFSQREHVSEVPATAARCENYLRGAYRRGLEIWPVFGVERLLESRDFQRAAES